MFYKTTRMTWVANELVIEGFHFFLECMRVPPNWHLWVYVIGKEEKASNFGCVNGTSCLILLLGSWIV